MHYSLVLSQVLGEILHYALRLQIIRQTSNTFLMFLRIASQRIAGFIAQLDKLEIWVTRTFGVTDFSKKFHVDISGDIQATDQARGRPLAKPPAALDL